MGNPNIAEIGKRFSSEYQPENAGQGAGRKKNYFNYLKEDHHLSQNDLDNIVNHVSNLSLSEIDRLLNLVKNDRKNPEVQQMPLLYFKILEGMVKAKTNDILAFMKMSGKASEKHEIIGNFAVDVNSSAVESVLQKHGINKSKD
jgi:hypothetical protein